jgi:hypothetical protein
MNKNEDLYFDMPEYNNVDLPGPAITATFKFRNEEDYNKFHELIKKHIYDGAKVFDGMQSKTKKNAWYPLLEKASKYEYR